MTALPEKRGILIFTLIAAIVLIGSFAAFEATGPMGIEERFHAAVGLNHDEEHESGGIAGFFLEGNLLLYLLVLVLLGTASLLIWRYYGK